MADKLYNYGSTDAVTFVLSLNGAGVEPPLQSADIRLYNETGGVFSFVTTIGGDVNVIDGGTTTGVYYWIPLASQTQCETIVLKIKDASGGGAFDENTITLVTGGDPDARFGG